MQRKCHRKAYEDRQGSVTRLIKHHLLLPHEIIGALYDFGKIEMVTGKALGSN